MEPPSTSKPIPPYKVKIGTKRQANKKIVSYSSYPINKILAAVSFAIKKREPHPSYMINDLTAQINKVMIDETGRVSIHPTDTPKVCLLPHKRMPQLSICPQESVSIDPIIIEPVIPLSDDMTQTDTMIPKYTPPTSISIKGNAGIKEVMIAKDGLPTHGITQYGNITYTPSIRQRQLALTTSITPEEKRERRLQKMREAAKRQRQKMKQAKGVEYEENGIIIDSK